MAAPLTSEEQLKPATQQDVADMKKEIGEVAKAVKAQNDTTNMAAIEETVKKILKESPVFNGKHSDRTVEIPVPDFDKAIDPKAARERHAQRVVEKMPAELRTKVNDIVILKAIFENPLREGGVIPVRELQYYKEFRQEAKEFVKALDTAASGGGADWVPTEFTNELWRLVRLQTKVEQLFRHIQMPRSPYLMPVQVGRVTSAKVSEQTADTGQTLIPVGDGSTITGSKTLTAVGHGSRVILSKEVEEDSIVPMLQFIQSEIITVLGEGREDGILNGDTTGSHQDSDVVAGDRRTMWKGLRKDAIEQSYTTDLSTFSTANLLTMRGLMGRYGANPKDVPIITGIKGYIKLLGLAEVITVDKYGPNATIQNGQLADVLGQPVIVSEWEREVLDSTGVYSASGTKTVLHMVNRNAYVFGEVRRASVQVLREIMAQSDQDVLLAKERIIFDDVYAVASNRITQMGINIG